MAPAASSPPPVIVLTGGIASGKSAVSDHFAHLGVPVVDTDILAREVVAPGAPGLEALVKAFGAEILQADGSLDRGRLRKQVFADEAARKTLESLLHPLIAAAARERIAALEASVYCVLVVPLLVETGLFADAEQVIVVDTPESLQVERLMRRDDIDKAGARAMLAAQASRQQRLARADHVIENHGSLDQLKTQVTSLHRRLLSHFGQDQSS